MAENTNETMSDGYTVDGRALEKESLPADQPVGEAPVATETKGFELEAESLSASEPVMPYRTVQPQPQSQTQPTSAPNAQQAYHATYGAPAGGQPYAAPQQPYGTPTAPRPAAPPKPKTPVDARRVFLTCGLVAGCIMIVFGLCMLAFYTPNAYEQAAQAVAQLGFLDDFSSYASPADVGASDAQVIKTGFALLLISLGATNICAFGAKLFEKKN